MHLCPALCLALSPCLASPYRLLSKTKVSIAAAGSGSNSTVGTASLSAKGAKLRNTYDSKHMSGFVLDLPDGVDEEEVISKLNAHDDVVKVVPDTWVGIAGAAGKASGAAEQGQKTLVVRQVNSHSVWALVVRMRQKPAV